MIKILDKIKGDKIIWTIVSLLAIFSFLPVYSASSNFGNDFIFSNMIKHIAIVFIGILIMYATHLIPYRYFKGLSIIALPVIILLLLFTALQGNVIEGANASRWIKLPVVGLSFQPSSMAIVILMVYTAFYLSKNYEKEIKFTDSILPLWIPISLVILLILPSNFSTAAMIFLMILTLIFIGRYPIKYLFGIVFSGIFLLSFFILFSKSYPDLMPNRVDTWANRIENYLGSDGAESNYQIVRAKSAIANGSVFGVGAGKSTMKNLLPQSTSDFIYAIITEEYGTIGAIGILLLYTWLLFRIIIVSYKSKTVFGQLLALGVGLPIIFQAYINMGVAVQLFPVTGQPLPLISTGGTSIWMTFLALGIVLSVSVNKDNQDIIDNNNPLNILGEEL
ncbi:MAG: FtsW/RodA/SpoVE family cell cycle protein [Flavobacteriaceae bacterium]|jgi:cell division protein FtsW|nr:FtsW/RodA/SpoVE family cell cycle protein [Pelagibacterales bacterium]MBT4959666.1 FtsW/RodA/SpoVE family cell cycle protein [Flavobacteriaceae bacterium]MDG1831212.1 FtsW/RodA/SpoVE family cell cycle protein [Flavobacteriaceae bacterium]|tara:strand:- start:421 stop:1596 length:1176 start_codon:yes stop_codon:yes gene_type:complete